MFSREETYLGQDLSALPETEALQTDIQRFAAILGFCLMAVFALVQSMPITEPHMETQTAEHLEQQTLREKMERLVSENGRLKTKSADLSRQADLVKDLRSALESANRSLARQEDKLVKLSEEKTGQARALSRYEEALREKDKKLQALETKRDQMKRTLDKVLAARNTAPPVPAAPESQTAQNGLYVAFISDEAFMALLKSGKIALFVNVEGMDRGFKVLNDPEGIRFVPGSPPSNLDLWEIGSNKIPLKILEAFENWTALSSRKKRFIVGLTPAISRPIRTSEKENGRFLIGTGGKVTYTP